MPWEGVTIMDQNAPNVPFGLYVIGLQGKQFNDFGITR